MINADVFRGGVCNIYYYSVEGVCEVFIKCSSENIDIRVEPNNDPIYRYKVVFKRSIIGEDVSISICEFYVFTEICDLNRIKKIIRARGVDDAARVIVSAVEALMPKYASTCRSKGGLKT